MAGLHANAMSTGKPLGFSTVQLRLTSIRKWVYDFEVVLNYFFDVVQRGFNLGSENFEYTTLQPKIINDVKIAPNKVLDLVEYQPPEIPKDGVVSKVYIKQHNAKEIISKLRDKNRSDLVAPVLWLLKYPEINFYFSPSGKLKQRDTSTWPIPAVETWPSWLREDLFGKGIDIDSAYTQFLFHHLKDVHADNIGLINRLYPDLCMLLSDKQKWRKHICENVLNIPFNDDNVSIVKKLCMALANGSSISPAILNGQSSFSVTKDIVIQSVDDISISNLERIGSNLKSISSQYKNARRQICTFLHKRHPSREIQKTVFGDYFKWERDARYAIWEEIDRHGIMVHDGIDGVPDQYLNEIESLIERLSIKITAG